MAKLRSNFFLESESRVNLFQASSVIVTTNAIPDQLKEKSYLKFQQEPVTDGEQHLIIIDSPYEQVSLEIYFSIYQQM